MRTRGDLIEVYTKYLTTKYDSEVAVELN